MTVESHSVVAVKVAEEPTEAGATNPPAKTVDIVLCDLPVEVINRTLGTELEPGFVLLSRAAQIHAARRHPVDFPKCSPHLAHVVENFLYVGDDDVNRGKVELICRVPALAEFMLVAVNLEIDEFGRYHIASFYIVSEKKIASRRQKGFLRVALRT